MASKDGPITDHKNRRAARRAEMRYGLVCAMVGTGTATPQASLMTYADELVDALEAAELADRD